MENNQIAIIENDKTPLIVQKIDVERLLSLAIEKGTSVDALERLLAMRLQLKQEWAREEYFRELAEFQSECPVIAKTQEVFEKDSDTNVRYRFAPLDSIIEKVREPLKKHGFSYTIKTKQASDSVTAVVEAHHVAGHTESTEFTIPIDPKAYMNAAQKVASALTYAKRYCFCNAFGILTGDTDDDGRATNAETARMAKEGWDKSEKQEQYESVEYSAEGWRTALLDGLQKMAAKGRIDDTEHGEWRKRVIACEDDIAALQKTYKDLKVLHDKRVEEAAILAANTKGETIKTETPQPELY